METLYKYYSPMPYNFDALLEGYLFFSYASNLNDPFDCSAKLRGSCYCINQLKRLGVNLDNANNIMQKYGVCCFSKKNDNKNMWAKYADNYKGFVIGYDVEQLGKIGKEILDNQIHIPFLYVNYIDEVPDFQIHQTEIHLHGPLCDDIKMAADVSLSDRKKQSISSNIFVR